MPPRCERRPFVIFFAVTILAMVKGQSILFGAIAGLVLAVVGLQSMISKARRRFSEGNLCASQVVSANPYTVAVLTNLSNDRSNQKLAIKILKQPLDKMAGGAPKNGAKLVAVSLYFGPSGTGSWEDFKTIITNCGCSDLNQIKRAFDSIDLKVWQNLTKALT